MNKFKCNYLFLSVTLITGSVTTAEAAVIPDAQVRQEINKLTNANGSETVNINAPSASGISHNKYSRFDINDKGLILNNSKDRSLTAVAGVIAGNRNLNESAPARVILNEVTSSQASRLEGNLEVAGQQAHVIIANPNGITCNGCDFINTSRNTLTTGKPVFNNGELSGFQVEKGAITITAAGMKDKYSEYTDLIGRYVAVNGGVAANNLTIVAGRNEHVSIANGGVAASSTLNDSGAEVLIDVSALGSMYANKITMVANNNGVGVRNAGLISAASDLHISARGDISNERGAILSDAGIVLNSEGRIKNQGGLISAPVVGLKAQALINDNATVGNFLLNKTYEGRVESHFALLNVENKIANAGKLFATDYMNISARELENTNGNIISGGSLNITADSISNISSGGFSDDKPDLTTGILSQGDVNINAASLVNNGQIYAINDIAITTNELDTKQGHIQAANNAVLDVKNTLHMADAVIGTGRDLTINAGNVNNDINTTFLWLFQKKETKQGKISAGGDLAYRVGQSLSNHNAIAANGAVSITAADAVHNLSAISGNSLSLRAGEVKNAGWLTAADWLSVEADTSLINDGVMKGAHSLVLSAPVVKNSGTIESASSLIYAPSFYNSGTLAPGFNIISTLRPQAADRTETDATAYVDAQPLALRRN